MNLHSTALLAASIASLLTSVFLFLEFLRAIRL